MELGVLTHSASQCLDDPPSEGMLECYESHAGMGWKHLLRLAPFPSDGLDGEGILVEPLEWTHLEKREGSLVFSLCWAGSKFGLEISGQVLGALRRKQMTLLLLELRVPLFLNNLQKMPKLKHMTKLLSKFDIDMDSFGGVVLPTNNFLVGNGIGGWAP